jgi:hypothetical protein
VYLSPTLRCKLIFGYIFEERNASFEVGNTVSRELNFQQRECENHRFNDVILEHIIVPRADYGNFRIADRHRLYLVRFLVDLCTE